jgi:hypothetical protein
MAIVVRLSARAQAESGNHQYRECHATNERRRGEKGSCDAETHSANYSNAGQKPHRLIAGFANERFSSRVSFLPRALDAKRAQPRRFLIIKIVLYKAIHSAPSRSPAKACAQFRQVVGTARGHNLHVAVLGIAYPAAQIQFAGLAMDKPSEPNALHSTLNQEMKNHRSQTNVSLSELVFAVQLVPRFSLRQESLHGLHRHRFLRDDMIPSSLHKAATPDSASGKGPPSMHRLPAVFFFALSLVIPLGSSAQAATTATADPLAPISWMVGTWKAQVKSPDGAKTVPVDLHIESVLGGKALGFTTSFNGAPTYQGLFAYDAAKKAIVFWYPSADGELTVGTVTPKDDYLLLDFQVTDSNGAATHFQSHMKRAGPDDYDWTLYSMAGPEPKQIFAVHYHRVAN